MSAMNAHSDVPPPDGWQDFLRDTFQVGVQQGRWGLTDRPDGRAIRASIKNSFFFERYGQGWDRSPFEPMVTHMLGLGIDTLETAMLMARGLVDEDASKLKVRVWEYEPPKTREGLLEWMNGGITRENVHTIEKPEIPTFVGEAKSDRSWSSIDLALQASGIPVPTGFDRAIEIARKYAEENNTTITGRSNSRLAEPDHIVSILREEDSLSAQEALDACKGIAEGLKKAGISLRDVKASLTGLPPAELGAWGGKCIAPPLGCGGEALDFRDRTSANEYRITGFCQKCQDATTELCDEPELNS